MARKNILIIQIFGEKKSNFFEIFTFLIFLVKIFVDLLGFFLDFFKTIFFLNLFLALYIFWIIFNVTAEGLPEGLYSPRHTQGFFPHFFILKSSRTSKEGFLFPMVSLGAPLENGEGMNPFPLVELNPNMLVRDVERMCAVHRLLIGC